MKLKKQLETAKTTDYKGLLNECCCVRYAWISELNANRMDTHVVGDENVFVYSRLGPRDHGGTEHVWGKKPLHPRALLCEVGLRIGV